MFDMAKLGKNISSRRKALGMTQMELADRLGISYQAVSNWERGNTSPDISNLGELAEILDCSVDELLGSRRTAEVLKQVEDEVEHPDITPEELADVAPILKPQQVDKTFSAVFADLGELISDRVAEAMGKVKDMQERLQSEHITERVTEKVNAAMQRAGRKLENFDPSRVKIVVSSEDDEAEQAEAPESKSGFDFDTLVRLAPHLPEDALNRMFLELADSEAVGVDKLAKLAPFLDEDVVGKVARGLFERDGSVKELTALAPFLSSDTVGEIAHKVFERGGDVSELVALAPFLDSDALGDIANRLFERDGDISNLISLAPFLDSDAAGEIAHKVFERGGTINDLAALAPFLDDDTLGELAVIAVKRSKRPQDE